VQEQVLTVLALAVWVAEEVQAPVEPVVLQLLSNQEQLYTLHLAVAVVAMLVMV
jgi:hypothetical protein